MCGDVCVGGVGVGGVGWGRVSEWAREKIEKREEREERTHLQRLALPGSPIQRLLHLHLEVLRPRLELGRHAHQLLPRYGPLGRLPLRGRLPARGLLLQKHLTGRADGGTEAQA